MKRSAYLVLPLLTLLAFGCTEQAEQADEVEPPSLSDDEIAEMIIAKEKATLDRWGAGDALAYAEIASDDISYFDPGLEMRLDGKVAFTEMLTRLQGKIFIYRYEMLNTEVKVSGDIAVLSFNLVNYSETGEAGSRWNSTEVYRNIGGDWKLTHSHWSFTNAVSSVDTEE